VIYGSQWTALKSCPLTLHNEQLVHQQENIPLLATSIAHFLYFIEQVRAKQESREIFIEFRFDSIITEAMEPSVWLANGPTDFAQNI